MTTEELKIRITADVSDVKKKVEDVKKDIADMDNPAVGMGMAKGAKTTTKAMEELQQSMEQVRNLDVFGILLDQADKLTDSIAAVRTSMAASTAYFKLAGKEFMGAFDFKNFDVGNDGIRGIFQSMGVQAKESAASVRQALNNVGTAFKGMHGVVTGILSSIVAKVAIALGMIVALVATVRNASRVAEQGKQMNVLAQQAGMTAQSYQKWAYVLEQTGLAVDDMIGAQQTLLEAQVDVREGNEEMIAAFEQIGLSQQEVIGMNQQQLFERTVAGLQNMGNATERATVAFKLLSEDSKNLAPLLNLTNEQVAMLANNYDNLHSSMSDKLIVASNRMSAALGSMRAAWQGLKNTLAEAVLPVLTKIVGWITKAIVAINLFLRTIFGMEIGGSSSASVDGATDSVGGYTESVDKATEAVQKLKRTTMGFDELNIVTNPNTGSGSGADDYSDSFGGGFASGATDGLFGADAIDTSKIEEFFNKYKNLVQDISTYGLIGLGIVLAILGGVTGNIPLLIAGIGLAALGISIGNVDGGSFDRLMQKYGEEIQGIIAPAMIGIGASLAVIGGLTGNIPLLIAGASMAGIGLGLAALGNENGFKGYLENLKKMLPDIINWAIVAVGACGAVMAIMTGNIPLAIAFGAMAGIGLYNIATGGSLWEDMAGIIKKAWGGLKDWFNANVKPIFTKEWWSNKFGTIKEGWEAKTSDLKVKMQEKWNGIAEWWNGGPGRIFTKEWWSSKFNSIKESAETKLTETKTAISNRWAEVTAWFNTSVGPKLTKQYWLDKFNNIQAGISTKLGEARTNIMNSWNNIKAYWTANIAPKFTKQYWMNKFETLRAALSEKLNTVRTIVMNTWNNVKSYWNTNIAPKFTKSYWTGKFDTIRAAANEKLTAAKTVIQNAWNNIKSWFNNNVSIKFTSSFWKTKFDSIKNGAKSAFNGIIAVVEKAVNNIIKKINTLSWKIPDWVPSVGGKSFGFNFKTVSIPRLAEGGIAVGSTLANIGERGKEAILPLENNTGWMDSLADRLAARMNPATKVILKVDERELGYATINAINQNTKQTGGLKLQLV